MAQAVLATSTLRLVFETGVDAQGKAILKAKTYSNLKKEATADQLFDFAQAIGSLSNDPINSIERSDRSDVIA